LLKEKMAKTTIFFLLLVNLIWSATLYLEPTHTILFNYLYNVSYGVSFLIAGIVSLSFAKQFSQNKKIYTQVFFATILFFTAQLIWFFYNTILHSEVPYPGIPDLLWVLFYLLNLGIAKELFNSLKIQFNSAKIFEILAIFFTIFIISHSFVTINDDIVNLSLTIKILNIAYPLFDSLLVAIFLSSIRSSEGRFKPALLFFTSAFFIFTMGDSLFTYQTALHTYWNGNFVDALFAISGYLYAMGAISLPQILSKDNTSDIINTFEV
jgi:hypothetical protein